jgi:multicomponent Na+:H+ antiporter subunit D
MDSQILLPALIFLPAALGFLGCVLPRIVFPVSVAMLLAYAFLSQNLIGSGVSYVFTLVGEGGIQFSIDLYTFPLVFGSSITLLICFGLFYRRFSHYFYQVCLVLFTALLIAFSTIDLVSMFIALELVGFAAFLLIADRSDKKSLFHAFQYLIGGGLAMLIYLIGVVQAFTYTGSFLLTDLVRAPETALCLIVAGLLTKSGVFLCGLWVPNIYSHANCQSSAVLSGCVTCAGIAPIARMSQILIPIGDSMVVIGVVSAVVAAIYAVFERESGRALGWSSVSQLGIAILSPTYACAYAMQHGICKALLFSTLHTKDRSKLSDDSISHSHNQSAKTPSLPVEEFIRVIVFVVASLSIMGFPYLSGFITKNWVKTDLPYEAKIIYTTAALLTSTVYARLIFDRVSNFIDHQQPQTVLALRRISRNVNDVLSTPRLWILLVSIISLIYFSFVDTTLYSTPSIRSAIVSAILGGILFISVVGIQADEFVKPITRTLDLVGAPFLVAALLLANLLYLKI